MFCALGWLVVVSLLALWSLAAWAFHAIAAWTLSSADVLAVRPGVTQGLRMPDWLAPWVPPEFALVLDSMASALMPGIEAVLGWAPALEGGLAVAVWVVWGIGSALLIVLGLLVTGLITVLRRRVFAPATHPGSAPSSTSTP